MYLGKADVNTFDKGAGREFLVSNGQGGYGFSTVVGANTRREHGLLVVKNDRSALSTVLISKVEETLFSKGKKYQLSTNRYKDVVYPDGYRYIQEYEANPLPSTLFVIHSTLLKKTIFMPRDSQSTVIKYELLASPETVQIELRPLCSHRSVTSINRKETSTDSFQAEASGKSMTVSGNGFHSHVYGTRGEWEYKPLWFENVFYALDECAEEPDRLEDLWSPGLLSFEMAEGDVMYVVAGSEPVGMEPAALERMERETVQWIRNKTRDSHIVEKAEFASDLLESAMHCFTEDAEGKPAVLTGFPSVKEAARDTFIALPGFARASGKFDTALAVLENWMERAKANDGIMPTEIDAVTGKCLTIAVDTGLWYVYAMDKLAEAMESMEIIKSRWQELKMLVNRYMEPIPELDLSCDSDGLLTISTDNPARHWMNGSVNGKPVVKRKGRLVEINALWYYVLRKMEHFSELLDDDDARKSFGELAEKTRKSFLDTFWSEKGYLKDWVDGDQCDDAIRCNQVLAVSLPASPLDPERGRSVTETCWRELYTTYGLRTLDPHHDKYKGRYEGRLDQKEKARFRGMAWPWLLGQFITAFLKFNPDRQDLAWCFVRPFKAHLRHGCLGAIAQNFDGSMPYCAHGDALSAMSVGEILRVIDEDLQKERGI
ncbi:MAG: amylo-alpha-1,6-glucosidase [Thermovirgaceae bacterium]